MPSASSFIGETIIAIVFFLTAFSLGHHFACTMDTKCVGSRSTEGNTKHAKCVCMIEAMYCAIWYSCIQHLL